MGFGNGTRAKDRLSVPLGIRGLVHGRASAIIPLCFSVNPAPFESGK